MGKLLSGHPLDTVRDGSKRWKTTAVGYFLGKRPYYHHLKEYTHSVWPALREVTATANGFFFFKFKTLIDMEDVIEGGPWLFQGQPIVLQKWEPASGVGKPLYPDANNESMHEIGFRSYDVEYEWLPPKCTNCMTLGHMTSCPLNKTHKPSKPPTTMVDKPRREEGEVIRDRNIAKHNDRDHQLALKDLVSECRLHFLGILETRWFADYNSIRNRIWLAWDENFIDVHVLDLGEQFVHCRITSRVVNESVLVTVVYAATEVINRRILWTALETLAQQCSDAPWLVGGDFNTVRDLNEVCGIPGDIRMATAEFNIGILEAGLIPLPMQGEWFTWHNCSTFARSLWKRLDRILINDHWLARFPTSSYHSLTPRTFDHSPLVLHGDTQQHNGSMFGFDNYLAQSPEFIPNVQNIWHHKVVGIPMYAVTRKLKALKPVFRIQRRNKGNLTMNVQLAKGFLDEAQLLVSCDRQNELFLLLEHCCRIVYAKATKLEQIMLQQRAKMQWMKDGDQCSWVFFRKIAQRRVMWRILQINDENGTTHTDRGEVVQEFVSYYQNLLGGTRQRLTVDIRYLRPWAMHCITDEEASHLLLPFSSDDVKQAVFDIAEDKAPGPDGYSSGFFKAAWPVVGKEVTRSILDFFLTGKLLKQVNSTILALIPKRLSVLLEKIISPCQTAFIPGRSIGDNIMLAQELFSGYNQMRLPPRCALKVDIRKAYDTVEWDFLLTVLQLVRFPPKFTRWIEESVSTTSFSIGLNGIPHRFFTGVRGLR
ncbi:UNVERIFIED_CONTAM: hypothetical protein Sindi_1263300 [Sesamum indicum]